jgi:hypothetical protein
MNEGVEVASTEDLGLDEIDNTGLEQAGSGLKANRLGPETPARSRKTGIADNTWTAYSIVMMPHSANTGKEVEAIRSGKKDAAQSTQR